MRSSVTRRMRVGLSAGGAGESPSRLKRADKLVDRVFQGAGRGDARHGRPPRGS